MTSEMYKKLERQIIDSAKVIYDVTKSKRMPREARSRAVDLQRDSSLAMLISSSELSAEELQRLMNLQELSEKVYRHGLEKTWTDL
jgi:hypothetical protein